jgi:EAL domain-containing protein (putative c-di-GMP-specific phosphodiesterase class I)
VSIDSFRTLGLAFAAADVLFETDTDDRITFAAGAARALSGDNDAALIGRPWRALFAEGDQAVAEALLTNLEAGERRGPAEVRLATVGGEAALYASLSVFRLPGNGERRSCALTALRRAGAEPPARAGLLERAGFEAMTKGLLEAARWRGLDLELGFVEFGGLATERSGLSPAEADQLDARIAGALRAEAHGDAAARLGDSRFAVLRPAGEDPAGLARRLNRVLGAALAPSASLHAIDAKTDASRLMRALRYALDTFAGRGPAAQSISLSDILDQSVQKAVAEAGAFGAMVQERRFKLVYQPVVRLADRSVHHYEALVRFEGDQSPFATIRMAEELDLIEHFDQAMTESVIQRLRKDPAGKLRLAVNLSGRTIVSTGFIDGIARMAQGGDLAGRLMFEVTETAAIDDLALAQRHIQALQALKFQVCLDDFGAGAASFAYLRQLKVDVVKIDGSYVRELTSSGRDDAMIRHLVGLCRELGASTVAEMVETPQTAERLASAGVDYAQGWLFGQPAAEPVAAQPPPAPPAARRRGAVEQWG